MIASAMAMAGEGIKSQGAHRLDRYGPLQVAAASGDIDRLPARGRAERGPHRPCERRHSQGGAHDAPADTRGHPGVAWRRGFFGRHQRGGRRAALALPHPRQCMGYAGLASVITELTWCAGMRVHHRYRRLAAIGKHTTQSSPRSVASGWASSETSPERSSSRCPSARRRRIRGGVKTVAGVPALMGSMRRGTASTRRIRPRSFPAGQNQAGPPPVHISVITRRVQRLRLGSPSPTQLRRC